MIRSFFERFLRSHWTEGAICLRYWDGRETTIGTPPILATIHFHRPSVLWQIALNPSLGFGKGYIDGLVTIDGDLQQFLHTAFSVGSQIDGASSARWMNMLIHRMRGEARPGRAKNNARFHYDTGNEFFRLWLDPSMTYSCAYFRTEEDDISTAQAQKRELMCRKLELAKGQTLLDVGCGWGALLFHAMERYGVSGIGITPSREQVAYITAEAQRRGLADRLTLHINDWRELGGTYDRVVSVGMYEHVGQEHGTAFFRKWKQWLKPDGVSLLHTIGAMDSIPPDPWITKYIFPGGYLPALHELANHARDAHLLITDVENLWRHYALTLAAWSKTFHKQRQTICNMHDDRFYRMWWLYLNASEAAFATGRLMLWQLVMTGTKRSRQPLTREAWSLASSPQSPVH